MMLSVSSNVQTSAYGFLNVLRYLACYLSGGTCYFPFLLGDRFRPTSLS